MTHDELSRAVAVEVLGYVYCEDCLIGDYDPHYHRDDGPAPAWIYAPPSVDSWECAGAVIEAMGKRFFEVNAEPLGGEWEVWFQQIDTGANGSGNGPLPRTFSVAALEAVRGKR